MTEHDMPTIPGDVQMITTFVRPWLPQKGEAA